MRFVTTEGTRPSWRAAAEKLPSRATRTKAFMLLSVSMDQAYACYCPQFHFGHARVEQRLRGGEGGAARCQNVVDQRHSLHIQHAANRKCAAHIAPPLL